MYILTSAVKNIRRYAGRYILFGLLIFIVLTIGTISISTGEILNDHLKMLFQKYGCTVLVTEKNETLSRAELAQIGNFPEVSEIRMSRFAFGYYTDSLAINGKPIDLTLLKEDQATKKALVQAGISLIINGQPKPELFLCGIDLSADIWKDEEKNASLIVEGRFPITSGETMIADNFASLFKISDLSIGSKITLSVGWQETEFTVVGIYKTTQWEHSERMESMYYPFIVTLEDAQAYDKENNLEQYYQAMRLIHDPNFNFSGSSFIQYDSYLILKNYDSFAPFKEKIDALNQETNTRYKAEMYYPGADNLMSAFESTAKICTFFLTAVIATSAAVILIMTALAMHERRYEIGVLLSVGMGKGRIALLFAVENLIFTLGVTILAYAVGLAAAPFAADKLLEGVVTISRAAAALPVAARMLALAVGLSLPASLISSLAILRYKPMTILRSRT